MVSAFLDREGKFKSYLELCRLNGKGEHASTVEAVFGKPVAQLEASWSEFLKSIKEDKAQVDKMMQPRIFASEAEFLEAEKTGFLDESSNKLDNKLLAKDQLSIPDEDSAILPAGIGANTKRGDDIPPTAKAKSTKDKAGAIGRPVITPSVSVPPRANSKTTNPNRR
ncbi:MAG: hypothetical protein K2X77_27920 [Candidatus Obscuribacterales bacterium]|nr:hypothetical protein [Candidatus Obscuribacterales bacterium]